MKRIRLIGCFAYFSSVLPYTSPRRSACVCTMYGRMSRVRVCDSGHIESSETRTAAHAVCGLLTHTHTRAASSEWQRHVSCSAGTEHRCFQNFWSRNLIWCGDEKWRSLIRLHCFSFVCFSRYRIATRKKSTLPWQIVPWHSFRTSLTILAANQIK